ncbi:SnoaL-like polyketide cyclase [Streptomyces sp. 1222.5]|uniref:ester cyclase n=1 Tax=unclassified Streptomyces TaxID=2593676 RepID=UPI00089A651B|nr:MULTISPECIES: ester cyclase [unclassified Streptomyces]PKW05396.1 SnoaL-like polyketide cyclase [Streptomyces sp. 5112.2]SED40986.1 SnoaL-like polyketide cyclase [Streptomyces sp. 1222.5]
MTAEGLAAGLFEVLETGDPALAAEVVHEEFRNREAAVAPPACRTAGPAGVPASGAWMRSAFEGLRLPFLGDRRRRAAGVAAVAHAGAPCRGLRLFKDGAVDRVVPPTGRGVDFEQIHVLDLRDGKVIRHEAVRDDITMFGRLGVFPPTPAAGMRMLAWRVTGRASRAAAEVAATALRTPAAQLLARQVGGGLRPRVPVDFGSEASPQLEPVVLALNPLRRGARRTRCRRPGFARTAAVGGTPSRSPGPASACGPGRGPAVIAAAVGRLLSDAACTVAASRLRDEVAAMPTAEEVAARLAAVAAAERGR